MDSYLEKILLKITESLEITDTQMESIETSYNAVAEWLDGGESFKKHGKVRIFPQGSVGLGTVVRPINDEYDIDMVITINSCSIEPLILKQMVGNRLKEHETYRKMLDREGKRCWTLNYSESLNYHMDILPTEKDTHPIIYKGIPSISATNKDNERDYSLHSTNPEAYRAWFLLRAIKPKQQIIMNEDIEKIEPFPRKTILQRTVQLLKRHRDIMFDGKDDKPISIIITTLAARAYYGEMSILESLKSVVGKMHNYIEYKNYEPIIRNPVDVKENFAEKWKEEPLKKKAFFEWLHKVKEDIYMIDKLNSVELGSFLKIIFGENIVNQVYESIADELYFSREKGNLLMNKNTGLLNFKEGATVKPHTFYGQK